MDECKVVELIRTTIDRRGKGVVGDPIRVVTQYWTKEGILVMEFDACHNPEPVGLNF